MNPHKKHCNFTKRSRVPTSNRRKGSFTFKRRSGIKGGTKHPSPSQITIIGIFSKHCIHCNNMKADWQTFVKLGKKKKQLNIITVYAEKITNHMIHTMLQKYNVNLEAIHGFPTILKISTNNNMTTEYHGNRTSNDLLQWSL